MVGIKKIVLTGSFLFALLACSGSADSKPEELFKAGKYEEVIEATTNTLQLDPDNKQALYNRARAYDELKNYEAAIADFKAALKYDDGNVRYLLSLGDVYYKQEKFDNALYYYKLAVEEEGNNILALYKKAKANHQLGNVEEAMSGYEAVLRQDNKMGEAYFSRAALKLAKEDKKGACEDLRQAVSLGAKGASEALEKYCN